MSDQSGNTDPAGRASLRRRTFLQLSGAGAVTGVAGALVAGGPARAATPGAEPRPTPRVRGAAAGRFQQFVADPPFSFTYGGRPSTELLSDWAVTVSAAGGDADRVVRTVTWSQSSSGLHVRADVVVYPGYDAIEWTVHFTNAGSTTSARLSDVLAVDTVLHSGGRTTAYTLHHFNGSADMADDYAPADTTVSSGHPALLFPNGGRPSNGTWPYFNVDWGEHGAMVAVGWPGQWCAQMQEAAGALTLRAGMTSLDPTERTYTDILTSELLDTTLTAGETVRTPLIAVMQWQAVTWQAAQNQWRRWMARYNMPLFGGTRPEPIIPTTGSLPFTSGQNAEYGAIEACVIERTTLDRGGFYTHWWIDAGWYAPSATKDPDWFSSAGNWFPDPARFPDGLSPTYKLAQEHDLKSLLWSEPERAMPHTELSDKHPSWLIGLPGVASDQQVYLFDFGNPQAYAWAVDRFDSIIRHQGGPGGLDVFRQDFNMDPLAYWNAADVAGRRGMTQVKHVVGHLAFWDELRRRHPAMWIDSCASGGRRNDLETMRRAVPLLRSDYQFEPTGNQSQTYGISFWLPYYGTGVGPQSAHNGDWGPELYVCRSSLAPCYASSLDADSATDEQWDVLRRMNKDFEKIKDDLLYSDFYPLTTFSLDDDVWMTLQYNRPDAGSGTVLAFRRPNATDATRRFTLHGLDADARYAVISLDGAPTQRLSGRQLATTGLAVSIADAPDAAILHYKKVT